MNIEKVQPGNFVILSSKAPSWIKEHSRFWKVAYVTGDKKVVILGQTNARYQPEYAVNSAWLKPLEKMYKDDE